MSQFSQALTAAADKNRQLLGLLSQTDYAKPSLQQNIAYISHVKDQLAQTNKELVKLHTITEDERKDHLRYRDSTVKRFAYQLGGHKGRAKFASRQEKEEREFLEAWQREREATDAHAELTASLAQAESDRAGLEADAARHSAAQHELDTLYATLFAGPTPDVPGEDGAEAALHAATAASDAARAAASAEHAALAALRRAHAEFARAGAELASALDASRIDVFGGGTFADLMEREALSRAQNAIVQGARHVGEARRRQPLVRPLSGVEIDQGHFVSDVLFDNIFSDMAQHDRIRNSATQLRIAAAQLGAQIGEQTARTQEADLEVQGRTERLEMARRELQRIRAEAFERFAGAGGAPPAYQGWG